MDGWKDTRGPGGNTRRHGEQTNSIQKGPDWESYPAPSCLLTMTPRATLLVYHLYLCDTSDSNSCWSAW